jgi:hypothetical protein
MRFYTVVKSFPQTRRAYFARDYSKTSIGPGVVSSSGKFKQRDNKQHHKGRFLKVVSYFKQQRPEVDRANGLLVVV